MLVCVCAAHFWQRYQQRRRQRADRTAETGVQNPQVPLRLRTLYGQRMSHTHTKVILFCECVRADGKHTHRVQIYPRRGAAPHKLDFTLDVCAAPENNRHQRDGLVSFESRKKTLWPKDYCLCGRAPNLLAM
jgi:hypothetical protein